MWWILALGAVIIIGAFVLLGRDFGRWSKKDAKSYGVGGRPSSNEPSGRKETQ